LQTPRPPKKNKVLSSHDSVLYPLMAAQGWSTAEIQEGDCAIIIPDATMEWGYNAVSHFTADTWRRYHVRFPDEQDTTSVDNGNETSVNVAIYPNPSHGRATLMIPGKGTERVVVSIFNAMGIAVASATATMFDGSVEVNLDDVPQGMYLVHCTTGNAIVTVPVTVQR
jgi:hypothetical protein